MWDLARRLGAVALALGGLLAVTPAVHAQIRFGRPVPSFTPVQSVYQPFIPTQLQSSALKQWAFNTAVIGRAYAQVPPYLFGYNPYPQSVNYGPVYQPPTPTLYGNPYLGGGYSANPYLAPGGYGGGYTSGGSGGGYGGGYMPGGSGSGSGYGGGYTSGFAGNPYGYDPSSSSYGFNPGPLGGYLYGSSAVISAYGNLSLQQQQAHIMAEMAKQAKLDTRKKTFDTLKYINDNTPTWGQIQAKNDQELWRRIMNSATPPEIWSGKSLNVLLKNLRKSARQKSPVPSPPLEEDILKRLNVTREGKGGISNLGLLRNNGEFTWPLALSRLAKAEELRAINKEVSALFIQATNAQVDRNRLAGLRVEIERLRKLLVESVNAIATQQYLDATRFLNDFDAALLALDSGDAARSLDFQSKFAASGKTVQELVNYMTDRGLEFAPATPGDEDAYHAAHAALVTYSVAVDQLASNSKE